MREFDLSNMEDKYKLDDNYQVLGKMKSEVGSKIIREFVAPSPNRQTDKEGKRCFASCEREDMGF